MHMPTLTMRSKLGEKRGVNNAHLFSKLLIFLFSRNVILEVEHFRLLYRQNLSECSVECCTIRKVSGNAKLLAYCIVSD